jgi:peptidoglycan/LPS O-acetylase OafA/YrhL
VRTFAAPVLARTAALPNQRAAVPRSVLPGGAVFRPDIEGLRAVAVLLVVLAHAGVPHLAGGYVGVDVFFVISGFLITALLLREAESTGRISVPRFYARRAVRLLPAAALVLVATLIGARLWLPAVRLGEYARDAMSAAGYLANLRFAEAGTDYLNADRPPSPFQHFWSLAVEEQFYLVWPLLLLASAYLWRRRRPLAAVLGVLVTASFALSVTETVRSAPWAYFGPHTRAWELGVGGLLALGSARLNRLPAALATASSWGGLGAILLAAIRFGGGTPYPGWRALLPVAGAAAVLAGARAPLLGSRPLQALGRLSYSWYLWHWPVLLIGPAALGIRGTTGRRLLLAAGALVLAAATQRWVEDPLRHRAALRDRPGRGLGLGLGLSATVAGAAVVLMLLPPAVAAGDRQADLRAAIDGAADPAAVLTRTVAAGAGLRRLPGNLRPALADAGRDKARVWFNGCHADWPATTAPEGCVFGDPAGDRTVVLFGDSHAAQWFPALERLATEHHWRLVELTKNSCSAADVPLWNDTFKRPYTECTAYHRSALARIDRLKPDLVIVASSFNYRPEHPTADLAAQWRAGWDRTFGRLAAAGATVAAIADTPYQDGSVPECLSKPRNQQHINRCGRTRHAALRGPEQRAVFLAYAGRPGTTVVDPTGWFCAAVCPPVIGNVLVYRDSNHMTTTYSQTLAPLLYAVLPH